MRRYSFLLAAALLAASLPAFATVFATVHGVVHDPQHRPIAGATVTLQAADSDVCVARDDQQPTENSNCRKRPSAFTG